MKDVRLSSRQLELEFPSPPSSFKQLTDPFLASRVVAEIFILLDGRHKKIQIITIIDKNQILLVKMGF